MSLGTESYSQTEISENIKVGNYSSIADKCTFHSANENHLCVRERKCVYTTNWNQPRDGKEIEIGSDVWIGKGVTILGGIKIGDGAIIGAAAVVAKDVPPYAVVVGNPGRVKRYRFDKETIKRLLELKWWDWPVEKVTEARVDMKDVDYFLAKYG